VSAAPHEIESATPSLRVVADQPPAPSLAQLLGHRTSRPQQRGTAGEQAGARLSVPAAAAEPAAVQQPPARAPRLVREPTFDELVTGSARHRGAQDPATGGSLLRRLALRARLLPTPARRPRSRSTGTR
jgi:hypothetical protein